MRRVQKHRISFCILSTLASALLLAGCGGQGVQLEGKLFELAGLTGKKNKKDKRVETRPVLVIPPKVGELPQPGPTQVVTPEEGWPSDPDLLRKRRLAAAKKKEKLHRDRGDLNRRDGMQGFRDVVEPLNRRKGLASITAGSKTGTTSTSAQPAEPSPDVTEQILNGDDVRTGAQRRAARARQERAAGPAGSTWRASTAERRKLEESDSPDITDGFIPSW